MFVTIGEVFKRRRIEASDFLEKSVTADCRDRYWKAHEKFNDYRATLPELDDPGEWFENCQSEEDRVEEAVMFYRYLYVSLDLRESQVAAIISGVSFCLDVKGHNTMFLESEALRRAQKACRRTPAEARVYNREVRENNIRDPADTELLQKIRTIYWDNRTWSSRGDLDARGTWLAVALGYDLGSGSRME